MIGPETIKEVVMFKSRAEVTFCNLKLSEAALTLDGVVYEGRKMSFKPVIARTEKNKKPVVGPNNLYVRDLDKVLDES